jgi:hypothetical protein
MSFLPEKSVYNRNREEFFPDFMRCMLFPNEWELRRRDFPEGIESDRQPDLILEGQKSSEQCLSNPIRWNPFQWRVAYVNPQGLDGGVLGITDGGFGRNPQVYYVSEIRLRNILRSMESNSTETIIECAWINQADVNLMLPDNWDVALGGANQKMIAEMEQAEEDSRSSKRVRRES